MMMMMSQQFLRRRTNQY